VSDGSIWEGSERSLSASGYDVVSKAIASTAELGDALEDIELASWWKRQRHLICTWQATGVAAVLKLDVDPIELMWTRALHEHETGLVPELFASGETLGPLDVRWLVHERMPFTLSHAWPDGLDVDMLIATGVRFQGAARDIDLPVAWEYAEVGRRRRLEAAIEAGAPPAANVLLEALDENWGWLTSTFGSEVLFGDLITPNVAVRVGPPAWSDGLLLDVGAVRGPWPMDAAWPEGKNGRGHYRGLVRKMARARAAYGLPSGDDADVARASAIVMGWTMLGEHYARPRDPDNSPPQDVIDAYLAEAAAAATG
jgi:hypothetical protein